MALVGVGVGHGTRHVARLYPDAVVGVPVDRLAETLSRVLAQALQRAR